MKICFCAIVLLACYAVALPSARSEAAIVTVAPQNETAEAHLAKGRGAYWSKDYKIAEKELKLAIRLKKDLPEAHLLLANVYRQEGNRDKALRHVRKAIKFQSNDPEAQYLMARLLFEKNDIEGAQHLLSESLGLHPQYVPSHTLKGDLEIAMISYRSGEKSLEERYKAAIEAYEEALRFASPQDPGTPILRERVEALRSIADYLIHKDDPAYERPIPLNRVRPNITDAARHAKAQGVIRLALHINEQGDVVSWLILKGIGYGLNEEAIKTTRALKFSPAKKNGAAVPFWQIIEIEFNMR